MAMQTSATTFSDGGLHVAVMISGICDGNGGDETLVPKVIPSLFVTPCRAVNIEWIEYEVSGGIVSLYWDANDPLLIMNLATRGQFDYRPIGGIQNPGYAGAALVTPFPDGFTGNILLTTVGFDAGSSYSIKLRMRKKGLNYAPQVLAVTP